MAASVPPEGLDEVYEELLDPRFSSYIFIGSAGDAGWQVAQGVERFIAGLQVFRVEDEQALERLTEDYELASSEVGLVFGFDDILVETLTRARAEKALSVMRAVWEARGEEG